MRKTVFLLLGFVLLLMLGCPSEEAAGEAEVPDEAGPGKMPGEEAPEEEAHGAAAEGETPGEVQNETIEEEPGEVPEEEEPEEEPIICVPVAVSGYAEVIVYRDDVQYYGDEGMVVSARELEIGKTLNVPGGGSVTLEEILLDADCEECGEKPSWTYSQKAKLRISVPNAPEDIVVVAGEGGHGFFNSSYMCKTLDWDGETCLEYVPDGQKQYYVGRVTAEKTCVWEE
ncbi:hypothetical protein GF412_01260 [Candidatus Micrarchaeota archaeon]|nr:hypothetical protein [Candidatus Micrarchaeota archaeon]MBD3417599.1 hypothetical protein [Candidatus Micrarchaeota archaeon]